MKGEQKRLVILDTHAILHRAYHALPEFSSSKGEPTGALYGLLTMLLRIVTDLKPDYIAATWDLADDTFRHAAFEKYKAHRIASDDALVSQIKRAQDVLKAFGIPVYSAKGFEADDCIGTIVEEMKGRKDVDLVIASGDMDTMQLIDDKRVRVFTLKKGLSDTVLYDEEGVIKRYGFGPELIPDYKGLRGDPSDNIPGVKGVGEKTATALITTFGSIEKLYTAIKKDPKKVLAAGVKEGMLQKLKEQEEEAKFSKMLAQIRTDAPIDYVFPKKTWREGIDLQAALDVLAEFEFRSLVPRVKQAVTGLKAEGGEEIVLAPELPTEEVEQELLAQTSVAAWLLDSNLTNPGLEDIYRVGKAHNFAEARENILKDIKEKNLSLVFEKIELPLMPVLRRMETRGVLIDRDFLKNLSKEYHKTLDQIAKRIYKAAGEEFNISSPKQLGDILFDKLGLAGKNQKKTAGGQRSTREGELLKLKDKHPIVEDILSYRELQKLLSTYIDSIPTLLGKDDRLHTSFIQAGTTTGRLGSQNPNVQNIPIKSEAGRRIREAFVADKGMTLVSFDYSQIELRIAAFLSGDKALTEIFRNGRDVHTEVAARVFGSLDGSVTYEQRRAAKVINFGILYGMGVTALQQGLGTNRKEAQEFYDQYFAAFPRLAEYLEKIVARAAQVGYTETHFGRRRYVEGIKSPIPFVKAAAERVALNAPIQGSAADLIKLAMIQVDKYLEEEGRVGHLLLQVHDELVFEIEEKAVKKHAEKIKEIMENVLSDKERNNIPFSADGKVGQSWGEMKAI